jgi:hypothetical protein
VPPRLDLGTVVNAHMDCGGEQSKLLELGYWTETMMEQEMGHRPPFMFLKHVLLVSSQSICNMWAVANLQLGHNSVTLVTYLQCNSCQHTLVLKMPLQSQHVVLVIC